ncbi:response regulator transcription factor [Pigmentiphaga sp. GD03639]|uniref:response regulator transcription factor n=1 Tax=Pigmentiphaga sp. GD03639 TaxID=2975354 RepID=UPI002449387A|nr:response regulator transcription factor [Pigmentiphaga sp. GD03639]MDH2239911.1 response regulator transcription factor [Pigmentiphaga sp. GD03639]
MKILIADDHRLVIEAVKVKLAELGPDVEFRMALKVEDLRREATDDLDLALIDLTMPGAEGYSHIAELRERLPALPIIVLSGVEDPDVMRAAIDLGALGFIPKAYSPDVMLSAVRLVLAGGVFVPQMMLSGMPHQPAGAPPAAADAAGGARSTSLDQLRGLLTERQIDVLRLLSQGKPNKLIARDLGISEGTVKIHLAAIFRALDVRNRTEAVVAARGLAGL